MLPEQLPSPDTNWGPRTKAAVVLGVRRGVITREQAYGMYRLSPEELASWDTAFDRGGYRALTAKGRNDPEIFGHRVARK